MADFMLDFNTFFSFFLTALNSLWSWLFGTILGKIIIFVTIISIFMWILVKLVQIGD